MTISPDKFHPTVKKMLSHIQGIIARYYGFDFFIVGSALQKENPRDIDVVACIPDKFFIHMYGTPDVDTIQDWINDVEEWKFQTSIWKSWAEDIAKQGRELTLLAGKQVDFKTQPESYFLAIHKPKFLIQRTW